jgi:hypothetical protein
MTEQALERVMDLIQAADAIRAQAKKYEQFVAVAAELERIGSFEQARQEAEAAHRAAVGALAVATDKLAVVQGGIEEAQAEAERVIVQARERAAVIVAEADGKALRAAEVAEAQIADKMAVAQSWLDGIEQAAAAATERNRLAISDASGRLAALAASTSAKQDELDALTIKIDKARREVAKLLGS